MDFVELEMYLCTKEKQEEITRISISRVKRVLSFILDSFKYNLFCHLSLKNFSNTFSTYFSSHIICFPSSATNDHLNFFFINYLFFTIKYEKFSSFSSHFTKIKTFFSYFASLTFSSSAAFRMMLNIISSLSSTTFFTINSLLILLHIYVSMKLFFLTWKISSAKM